MIQRPSRAALLCASAVAIAVPFAATRALAQPAAPSTVSHVEVVGRSIEETLPQVLGRYGSSVETVTAEDIKDGGFVDASEALEMLVPGAFVATQAGPFSYVNISIQGSRTSDVLWTVDGVRINNRLYNSTSPADTLPAAMIERMEVLKGGQGLFYGTSAVAGVINIVTRSFSNTPGAEISIGGDSFRGFHANGYVRGAIGGHKLVAWMSKDETDGYEIYSDYQPNTTNRRRSYDVNSYGVKYGYDFADDLALQASYVHTIANLDYPSVSGNSVNDRNEDIVSARLDYTPSDAFKVFLKSYYHSWDTNYYTKPNPSKYWGYKDFGLNGMVQLNLHKGVEYNIGYDFQNYRGRDDVLLIAGETEQVHAVFAQARTTDDLSTRARFAAGFRTTRTGGDTNTVWNVSGVFDITDNLYIRGVGGTSFLLPDAQQLYGVDPCCALGNPSLKPETSTNLNLTLGGRFDLGPRPVTWELAGWRRKVENLITTDRSNPPPGYPGVFINIEDDVKVEGWEIIVRAPITDALSLDGSYTHSKEHARGTSVQIAGRPKENAKFAISYAPPDRPFGVDLAAKWVGQTEQNVTGFGVQQYGDYVVVNLAGHVFIGDDRKTRLTVRIENLLDEDYATSVTSAVRTGTTGRFLYRRLGPPRMAYFNLSRTF
jgi:vitamin B12 transporter